MKVLRKLACFVSIFLWNPGAHASTANLRLPPKFKIEVFAESLPHVRSLSVSPSDTVFAGSFTYLDWTKKAYPVFALQDRDKDGKAEKVFRVAERMKSPNGVLFHKGTLYITDIDKIWTIANVEKKLGIKNEPKFFYDHVVKAGHHGWKILKIGPDGHLYFPQGVPHDIAPEDLTKPVGTILRIDLAKKDLTVVARGLRNSVGFDFHPVTMELWFTDNGVDGLGDDIPPEELNRANVSASAANLHFGFPFCHAGRIPEPSIPGASCEKYEKPVFTFPAHTAPLGLHFYTGKQFPAKYREGAFVALHGSMHRSKRLGYKVVFVRIKDNQVVESEDFVTGWLEGEKVSGRPVDFATLSDGSLLISDDFAGKIYRVTYTP